jgi:hypothetical protein
MQIEMVDTIRGLVPRVALDIVERVVSDTEWQQTIQVDYLMRTTGEIVRQDGHVQVKKWPSDMTAMAGITSPGG